MLDQGNVKSVREVWRNGLQKQPMRLVIGYLWRHPAQPATDSRDVRIYRNRRHAQAEAADDAGGLWSDSGQLHQPFHRFRHRLAAKRVQGVVAVLGPDRHQARDDGLRLLVGKPGFSNQIGYAFRTGIHDLLPSWQGL